VEHNRDYRDCDHTSEDKSGHVLASSLALVESLHGHTVGFAEIVHRGVAMGRLAFPLICDLGRKPRNNLVSVNDFASI
jgi:hypothetical protein